VKNEIKEVEQKKKQGCSRAKEGVHRKGEKTQQIGREESPTKKKGGGGKKERKRGPAPRGTAAHKRKKNPTNGRKKPPQEKKKEEKWYGLGKRNLQRDQRGKENAGEWRPAGTGRDNHRSKKEKKSGPGEEGTMDAKEGPPPKKPLKKVCRWGKT